MKRLVVVVAAAFLGVALMGLSLSTPASSSAQTGEPTMTPTPVRMYAGKVRAPDFPPGLDWINVSAPLTMNQLRGKVVLLDFWTYGCINCIHIIPDLKRLEAEFPNELMVIGVHSAKFPNEGETANIREIVARYGVEHPVVNDKDFTIWQLYGVRAWPTSMIIDPQGKVLGYYSGEGVYDALQPVIAGMVAEFAAAGQIDRTPIPLAPEANQRPRTLLSAPGKILADAENNRLIIADSGHNRLIVTALDTFAVQAVIGTGAAGLKDGPFGAATFNWPHGMALNGDLLYVADTRNHAIREVDLKAGTVRTLAGTGRQNRQYGEFIPYLPGLKQDLSSPWDVAYHDGRLYIAMAGPHQLWLYKFKDGEVGPYAGSGREGLVDGDLNRAELAQPSGIVTDGHFVYFTDAESSAVRKVDLKTGQLSTIVGTGLFDYGDVDGIGDKVRLQHTLGITLAPDGKLFIADTYNHKIKLIDPATRESKAFLGGGRGFQDGEAARFWEPGGLSYAAGKLYVADTNNNAIRVIDVASKVTTTLTFPNPEALSMPGESAAASNDAPPAEFFGETVRLPQATVAPGAGIFSLNVKLPDGYKLNGQAPFTLRVYNNTDIVRVADSANNLKIVAPEMPVTLPATFTEGAAEVTLDVAIFYCEAVNETLCFPAYVRFTLPLSVAAGGPQNVVIEYVVTPPQVEKSDLGGK